MLRQCYKDKKPKFKSIRWVHPEKSSMFWKIRFQEKHLKFYNIIFISYSANFVDFVIEKLTRIYLIYLYLRPFCFIFYRFQTTF